MEALLQHLVDITGQRDQSLLDGAVVSAMHSVSGATQVKVHELFQHRSEALLRP